MSYLVQYGFLIVVGILAGAINTLAGGGSLLTLPILIFMGLPSNVANATNRIGIVFQAFVGTAGYRSSPWCRAQSSWSAVLPQKLG